MWKLVTKAGLDPAKPKQEATIVPSGVLKIPRGHQTKISGRYDWLYDPEKKRIGLRLNPEKGRYVAGVWQGATLLRVPKAIRRRLKIKQVHPVTFTQARHDSDVDWLVSVNTKES